MANLRVWVRFTDPNSAILTERSYKYVQLWPGCDSQKQECHFSNCVNEITWSHHGPWWTPCVSPSELQLQTLCRNNLLPVDVHRREPRSSEPYETRQRLKLLVVRLPPMAAPRVHVRIRASVARSCEKQTTRSLKTNQIRHITSVTQYFILNIIVWNGFWVVPQLQK